MSTSLNKKIHMTNTLTRYKSKASACMCVYIIFFFTIFLPFPCIFLPFLISSCFFFVISDFLPYFLMHALTNIPQHNNQPSLSLLFLIFFLTSFISPLVLFSIIANPHSLSLYLYANTRTRLTKLAN